MKPGKVLYKPVGLGFGMLGGVLAGAVFKTVWARLGHEEEAPGPTDPEFGWREVLLAAALQGAIFSVVRAAVERGGAVGVRRMTGYWPG